ncbi:uncharacterized protein [Penaeus vannamei]|uniref:uncharacterized protein n=1 Tax=Penaeus vannamei TaxID=6689 RepID=UPI00387F8B44
MLGNSLRNRLRATLIRGQTKAEDVFDIKNEKGQSTDPLCRRKDGRWTEITGWDIDNTRRLRARPMTRWHDEITNFGGEDWKQRMQGKNDWKRLGEPFVLQ